MKQTSSALTFLLAQYRAIFKRAYVKGIASAVLLTAGLAAGAAQATANDLSSGWNAGDALVTETADDTFKKDSATVGGITINTGHKLTTSGSIISTGDMKAQGDLTIEKGAILLAEKETVGNSADQTIYRHNFTSNSGTTNLSGNVGAASFSLSNGTLVLTSGGEGNTNLTAYGSGWNQGYNGSTVLNADDYDRSTADGDLSHMEITVKSGTNIAALNRLTIDNDSKITLSGGGSGDSVESGDTAYLEGSNEIVITDTDITVTGYANGIFSKNGSITDSTITVNQNAKLLVTGNSTDSYTDVLSGSVSANAATYTLTGTTLTNSGTVHLDSAILNLNDGTTLTNSGTMILGRADEGNVININGAKITNAGNGYIWAQADVVMTDGSITLQSGQGIAGLRPAKDSFDFASGTGVANFTATGGTITLGDADIAMLDVTLGGNVEVTLTGADNVAWQENSHIDAAVEGTEGGVFTIQDNASVTMNNGSVLTAENFNLNGGTITMQASGDGSAAETSGSAAIIRGFGDSNINLNGGAINVVASKAGVIRGENINLAGTSINNQGTLTFAGSITNAASTNVNTVTAPATFQMTGGTLSNATGANLYFGVKGVDNQKSVFTIAGGTFTNAGTVNVASGSTLTFTGTTTAAPTISNTGSISVASGGSFTTAGTVTVSGTGSISIGSGASLDLGGEDVKLYGTLDINDNATSAKVTGKVTFYGDAQSGEGKTVDLKVGSGDFNLATGGTLSIQDVGQTIGLSHTYGESGGTFTLGTGFGGLKSDSAGTLYLDMEGVIKDAAGGAITSMTQAEAEQYADKLRDALGSGDDFLLNLQGITISLGQEVEDALASGDNTISYDQVSDALASGIENDTLVNTAVKVSSEDKVQGSIGQVQAEAGTTTVNVAGDSLKLNGYVSNTDESKNSNVLVQTGSDASTATVAGIKMQAGSTVSAEATGNSYIGAVTVEANDNGLGTFAVAAGSNLSVVSTSTKVSDLTGTETPTLTYADVGSANAKINTVQATGTLTAKDVYAVNTNVEQETGAIVADSLTTEKADIKGSVNVAKTIDVTVTTEGKEGTGVYNQATTAVVQAEGLKADTATLAGQTKLTTMEATNATFTGGTHTITKSLEVTGKEALVVTNGATLSSAVEGETSSTLAIDAAAGIRVDGNATLAANEINTSGDVYVGADATSEAISATEGAGSLVVNTLSLNNNDLIVDPAFGGKYSFVGVGSFSESGAEVDAGVMDGNAYALQNAILAIGETDEATVADLFAQYINPENQSLGQVGDKVGSIVYVAQQLDIASGNKLVSDSTATVDANGDFDDTKYATDAYIGDNSVLAISVDAASNANAAAVQFASNDAKITASSTGKVVITGDYSSVDSLKLFADAGTAGTGNGTDVEIVGANGLRVETLNGLMYADLTDSVGTLGIEEMHVNQDKVASAYTDASSSVRNSILSYVTGDTQWYNTKAHDINETRTHGARVDDVTTDGAGNYYWRNEDGSNGTALTDDEKANLTFVKVTVDVPADEPATRVPQTEYVVYEKANNRFLTEVREQTETSGAAAESAARMADFAGVAQVALKAGASTYEAISGRMGMGAENTSMTFANNGQGAGIWLTPIYQTSDSDGFEAQGLDYGADIDLYGIALGGDYTLANGVRVGAMFNVGSGEADGQGAGSAVSNDFDYYGFGLYAGYTVGQFSVVGDVSYTAVDNDVEANTNIDKLETSLDSSNLSLGVTGAYAFETAAGIEVTPHVGLRYSYIDIDDYSVKGKTTGTVGDYSADSLSVFSIPVGVTIASEFQAGSWSVKPSFDITLTGNFGDDENEGTFHWTGVENIDSSLTSEIFDNFTYGASLGVAAQSTSGISLGLTVGYTGSSNVDDLGVSANARFTF